MKKKGLASDRLISTMSYGFDYQRAASRLQVKGGVRVGLGSFAPYSESRASLPFVCLSQPR